MRDALVAVRLREHVELAALVAHVAGVDLLAAHVRAVELPAVVRDLAHAAARALRRGLGSPRRCTCT